MPLLPLKSARFMAIEIVGISRRPSSIVWAVEVGWSVAVAVACDTVVSML